MQKVKVAPNHNADGFFPTQVSLSDEFSDGYAREAAARHNSSELGTDQVGYRHWPGTKGMYHVLVLKSMSKLGSRITAHPLMLVMTAPLLELQTAIHIR